MTFTLGRRSLATMLVTGAATLGLAGSALADTTTTPTTPATPPTQHSHGGMLGGGSLLGGGLFKTLFGVFGAVRDQTPVIAAPIISQAVTAGTITQAQADELTALFTHKPATATTPAASSRDAEQHHGFTALAPEERTVLSQVMQAVATQLPAIAKPVVDAAVTAGDITQAQADMITKIIGLFANFKPGNFGLKPATSTGSATTVAPLAALQSKVTNKVVRKVSKTRKTSKTRKHSRAHAAR